MLSADLVAAFQANDGPDILSAILSLRERLNDCVERLRERCVGLDNDDLDLDAAIYELDTEIEQAVHDMQMELSI